MRGSWLLLLWGIPFLALGATEERLNTQRAQFVEAEQALEQGRYRVFQSLAVELKDYALYPYLRYAELRQDLHNVDSAEVKHFLNHYGDTPLAPRLRSAWLHHLAEHSRWQTYLAFYEPAQETSLRCHYRHAQLQTNRREEALEGVAKLWRVGYSQPQACDPVFEAWREAGKLTPALVWNRIELVMDAGRLRLARYLERFLPAAEQPLAATWRRVYRHPEEVLDRAVLTADQPLHRAVVRTGVLRLAKRDPSAASEIWAQAQKRYTFATATRRQIQRRLALAHALEGAPQALDRLADLSTEVTDSQLRGWRVRVALEFGAWQTALDWIEAMPSAERNTPRWQYWRARALAALEQTDAAQAIYQELAQRRSYYGFLAADRLDAPYRLDDKPLAFSSIALQVTAGQPGIHRARELYALGRAVAARREWYHATQNMGEEAQARAAKLASEWGWHDRAIVTVAGTRFRDDLQLRFPTPHSEQVIRQAEAQGVDPAWAFAVMRQESAFMADARSSAGALGIMQLMPTTARQVARQLDTHLDHPFELLNVGTNIRLGISHLRSVLDRFKGQQVLATAAYNAGQRRVQSWLPNSQSRPADLWVETVPFKETRRYLQHVLAYTVIYDRRLDANPTSLQERMAPITDPRTTLTRQEDASPAS